MHLAVLFLHVKSNELALAEERRLALRAHGVHHFRSDPLALGEYNLACFLIYNGLCEHLAEEAAAPAELFRQFIAADRCQIIAARVEEQHLEQLPCVVLVRRLSRTQTAVDLDDCLAARLHLIRVALDRRENMRIIAEKGANLRIRLVAERTDEIGHRHFARPVDAHGHNVVRIRLELDPRAAVRNRRGIVELLARRVDLDAVVGAGRANELADDDALRAVDDECARIRHEREIAHEHFLFLDLARLAVHEAHIHAQWRGIGHIALLALVEIILRFAERKGLKGKDEISREILNRRDIAENLCEPHLKKPLIAPALDVEEMRHLHDFLNTRVAIPRATADRHRIEHERCHPFAGLS